MWLTPLEHLVDALLGQQELAGLHLFALCLACARGCIASGHFVQTEHDIHSLEHLENAGEEMAASCPDGGS
jgi:hypothetical protein